MNNFIYVYTHIDKFVHAHFTLSFKNSMISCRIRAEFMYTSKKKCIDLYIHIQLYVHRIAR